MRFGRYPTLSACSDTTCLCRCRIWSSSRFRPRSSTLLAWGFITLWRRIRAPSRTRGSPHCIAGCSDVRRSRIRVARFSRAPGGRRAGRLQGAFSRVRSEVRFRDASWVEAHLHARGARDGRDCAQSLVTTYDVLTDEKLESLDTAEAPVGRRFDHRYVPWWVEPGRDREFLGSVPYVRAIWMWKEIVRRSRAFIYDASVAASGRVLEVRYEQLGGDAASVGKSVSPSTLASRWTPGFVAASAGHTRSPSRPTRSAIPGRSGKPSGSPRPSWSCAAICDG